MKRITPYRDTGLAGPETAPPLLDPSDDVAFFGWLRSPFVGARDETLLRISRDTVQPYAEHLNINAIPDADERALVERGIALIGRFAALRDRVPTSELLREVLEESGYLAHLALRGHDGLQAHANIAKFIRELEGMRDSGVADVLRTIEEARELDVMVETSGSTASRMTSSRSPPFTVPRGWSGRWCSGAISTAASVPTTTS